MNQSRFSWALIASCILHLGTLGYFAFHPAARLDNKTVETVFQKIEIPEIHSEAHSVKIPPMPQVRDIVEEKLILKKETMPLPEINRSLMKDMPEPIKVGRAESTVRFNAFEVKRKITIPVIDNGHIDNPAYLNYLQAVRDKIRDRTYTRYSGSEQGEVGVSFVVTSDGILRSVHLLPERTTASPNLQQISLLCLQEANPFPPFPKELEYSELPFSIIISFQLES